VTAQTAQQVADEISSATGRAYRAESSARHRGPHDLGLSALGSCTRKAAHMIAQTEPTDLVKPEEGRAANLGTMIHAGFLPRLAEQMPGARTEVAVSLRAAGISIPGHIDLYSPPTVLDVKTAAQYRLDGLRAAREAYADHRLQVQSYATAVLQTGDEPRWMAWLYLDRSSGDDCTVVEAFDDSDALDAVARVEEIVDHADHPDAAPAATASGALMRGPGSFACDECPWLRRCWGEFAEPGNPRAHRRRLPDPQAEMALADYHQARQAKSAAEQAMADALDQLSATPPGVYGRWQWSRGKSSEQVDKAAAVRLAVALGYRLPTVTSRGKAIVRPAPDPTVVVPKRRRRKTGGEAQ